MPLLVDCFPDSNILKDVKLGRTKTTNIIKNVIAKKETEDLALNIQKTFFSIFIDETTDVAVNKLLSVNVKFVDDNGISKGDGRCKQFIYDEIASRN